MLPKVGSVAQQITGLLTELKAWHTSTHHHRITGDMYTNTSPLSAGIWMVTTADLCASHREGVGRAPEGPSALGRGRGWSTGCLAEEGILETNTHRVHVTWWNLQKNKLLLLSQLNIRV